jgi:ferric-dicitrate binding protein FerR (iron transport regulator)
MLPTELQSLLNKYLDNELSEDEFARLWESFASDKLTYEWQAAIESAIRKREAGGFSSMKEASTALSNIKRRITEEEEVPKRNRLRVIMQSTAFRAAAAIVVIAGAAVLTFSTMSDRSKEDNVQTTSRAVADIAPGTSTAVLTLADGTRIDLENSANGKIAQEGNVQVIKLSTGEVQYKIIGRAVGEKRVTGSNTMSTPRGGQYQLQLPDGSKVWLNAESSITYPVHFADNERKVSITGEAYFEVAKDKTRPFRVLATDTYIEVLGTHFNVNAYQDEGPVRTTLLEGSVKINNSLMKPGEAYADGKVFPTDVQQAVAWKNGVFNFNDQNLSQIMLQLARWYDIEVVFPDGVPKKQYGGEIGRDLSLSQVLKGLENSGVHFDLQGRRLLVRP